MEVSQHVTHSALPYGNMIFLYVINPVILWDTQHCVNKGKVEEECQLGTMDLNNAGSKNWLGKCFSEERNAPQGYTQYVLGCNTECKQCLFTRKLHREP